MLSADKTKVEYSIDYKAYEQLLYNTLFKAPREVGVEVAVYMLLYGLLDNTKYNVLDISPMKKSESWVYLNEYGKDKSEINKKTGNQESDKTPDIVIVGEEFKYNGGALNGNNLLGAYAFIEAKFLDIKKYETEVDVQTNNTNHFIWTNGLKWVYRCRNRKPEVIADLGDDQDLEVDIIVNKDEFAKLLNTLNEIQWEK